MARLLRMLRIALRAHRTALLVMGGLSFFATYLQGAAFAAAAGHTAVERAAFAQEIDSLASQLAYLIPLPVRADTAAGYTQWRGFGGMTLVLPIWALLAATGAIRNEEERGLLETWLGSGLSRIGLIVARCLAFVMVAVVVVAMAGLGSLAGVAASGESVRLAGLLELCLAVLGLLLACYAIALLAAQLVSTRRAATGLGGAVLVALFLLDSLGRINGRFSRWAVVSPFHLRNMTTAMAPGGSFDLPATLALFGIAIVVSVLAAGAFRVRDLGGSLVQGQARDRGVVHTVSPNPLLRLPVISALYEERVGLLGWLVGSLALAALIVSLAGSMNGLLSNASFQGYFAAAGTSDPTLVLLGVFWAGIAALLIAVYAITQVAQWADEDSQGRLEMILAQPVPRWRVVVERAGALALSTALLAGAGGLAIAALAPGQGVHLDGGRLLLAVGLLVVLALSYGALGAAVIARMPRVAAPVLGALAVVGFFMDEVGPLFKWPNWALDISMFRLYGAPLVSGLFATGLYVMTAIVVVGFGLALVAMRTREVGR